jgi:hypothetical protein
VVKGFAVACRGSTTLSQVLIKWCFDSVEESPWPVPVP